MRFETKKNNDHDSHNQYHLSLGTPNDANYIKKKYRMILQNIISGNLKMQENDCFGYVEKGGDRIRSEDTTNML